MGFTKTIIEPNLQEFDYHNILGFESMGEVEEGFPANIKVGHYKNIDAKKVGANFTLQGYSVTLTKEDMGLIKRILYEVLKREIPFNDAKDHRESEDPNLLPLLDNLEPWELVLLKEEVNTL